MRKDKVETTKEKKVTSVKKWVIIQKIFEDGTSQMERTNDGFNSLELIGISDFISWEVREQILGRIVPDTIKRKAVIS